MEPPDHPLHPYAMPVAQGGSRARKINATSNRALSDAAISRLARGKRESPRREVSEFKRGTVIERTRPPDFGIGRVGVRIFAWEAV